MGVWLFLLLFLHLFWRCGWWPVFQSVHPVGHWKKRKSNKAHTHTAIGNAARSKVKKAKEINKCRGWRREKKFEGSFSLDCRRRHCKAMRTSKKKKKKKVLWPRRQVCLTGLLAPFRNISAFSSKNSYEFSRHSTTTTASSRHSSFFFFLIFVFYAGARAGGLGGPRGGTCYSVLFTFSRPKESSRRRRRRRKGEKNVEREKKTRHKMVLSLHETVK